MTELHTVEGTCVSVTFVVVGVLSNNVYIISDENSTMVVDPGSHLEEILRATRGVVDTIVLTHRHADHVGAARALRDRTGAVVIASQIDGEVISGVRDAPRGGMHFDSCPVDVFVRDGDMLNELVSPCLPWKVMHTPGHTEGGICLFLDPGCNPRLQGAPVLISGDTLFCGAKGRTDFEGGDSAAMGASLKRLATLPDETIVLPGHMDQTTIGTERMRVLSHYV